MTPLASFPTFPENSTLATQRHSTSLGMDMEMSDADMMVDMQMSIGHKFSLNHFLFDGWKANTQSKFTLTLLFIFVLCVTTEWLTYVK